MYVALLLADYPTCHHRPVMKASPDDDRYYYSGPERRDMIIGVNKL